MKEEGFLKDIIGHFYLLPVKTDMAIAVSWTCTDLSFTVHNFDGLFMRCPFCGTRYDATTGVVEFGIAPRPLDFMPIAIVDGTVVVDTGQITKRTTFDASQVARLV